jgi:hypothetical protein
VFDFTFHGIFLEYLFASGKAAYWYNFPKLNVEIVKTVLLQVAVGLMGTETKFQFFDHS